MFHGWQFDNVTNINKFSQCNLFSKNTKILQNMAFEKEVEKRRDIIYMAGI